MKISVTCIYWFLLLVSIVSSCLLFILVASEGVKASSSITSPSNSQDGTTSSQKINISVGGRTQQATDKSAPEMVVVVEGTDIRSSFDDVAAQDSDNAPREGFSLSQNSGVPSGLSDAGPAVVFTLVDTASAELQQRAAIVADQPANTTSPPPIVQVVEPPATDSIDNTSVSEDDNDKDKPIISSDTDTTEPLLHSPSHTTNQTEHQHEDIPSFSEWTQKQLEEAEKRKDKANLSAHIHHAHRLRSKNYASPDCGAKIVAANPEAVSAGSVLTASRDEYKLNTCTSRIWFVVELCEPIQAKKIELANFELFSSSPKDFTVSVADRFPTRDWTAVGHFQAKDERDVQSFTLSPHLFVKFVKVEMLSHWGSEHFCPISLFRVYGTSEFEVLETEEELVRENMATGSSAGTGAADEDDDDDSDGDEALDHAANNLFGSARDAVMSIVKKAAEVLVKSGDGSNQTDQIEEQHDITTSTATTTSTSTSTLVNTCSTPSHLVVCDNCSDVLFGNVYELLSCQSDRLHTLIGISIVNKSLYNTDICLKYGFNFYSKSADNSTETYSRYISTFFTPDYIAAFCNVLAVLDNKILLNISNQYSNASSINATVATNIHQASPPPPTSVESVTANQLDEREKPPAPPPLPLETRTCASEHQPTLTASVIKETTYTDLPIDLPIKPTKSFSSHKDEQDATVLSTHTPLATPERDQNNTEMEADVIEVVSADNEVADGFEMAHDQLDKLFSDLSLDADPGHLTSFTTVAPPTVPQQGQKESVFLRLSNRIKALERNMSLSGQYLEELSRRYKRQVEEMQRVFEKKVAALADENRRREERKVQLEEQLDRVAAAVDTLLLERESHSKTASLLGQFLLVEVLITCVLLYFCWKSPVASQSTNDSTNTNTTITDNVKVQVRRRQSIDTIGHESPMLQRRRRPSEEASLRITGTYQELLVSGTLTKAERRRRRKRNSLLRSQSMVASRACVPAVEPVLATSESPPSSPEQEPEATPFALEESEHSAVEPVDYFKERSIPAVAAITNGDASKASSNSNGSIIKAHSPLFMKTALSSRTKRNSSKKLNIFKTDRTMDSTENTFENSSHRQSPDSSIKSNSFSFSDSQDDQTSMNSYDTSKKEKKSGGFKKIFKRVFD